MSWWEGEQLMTPIQNRLHQNIQNEAAAVKASAHGVCLNKQC